MAAKTVAFEINRGKSMPERYVSIVDLLPDILYKLDVKGRFIYLNNSVKKLGYELPDLMEKHFSVIVHPDDRGLVLRDSAVKKISDYGCAQSGELKVFDERRTGKRITRDLFVRLIPNNFEQAPATDQATVVSCAVTAVGSYDFLTGGARKGFNGTIGVMRNVINLDGCDETASHRLRHYQSLLENTSDIIAVFAIDGTIMFASPSVKGVLGYPADGITGDNILNYIHQEDMKDVLQNCGAAIIDDPHFIFNCRVRGADNAWRVMKNTGAVIPDINGTAMCVVMVSRDITGERKEEARMRRTIEYMEHRLLDRTVDLANVNKKLREEIEARKMIETDLRESERNYRSLLESIDDIAFSLDPRGAILFVNPAIKKITGCEPSEMIGRELIRFIRQEDINVFLDIMKKARSTRKAGRKEPAGGVPEGKDIQIIRKDDTMVWVEMRCHAIKHHSGTVMGYRCIATDMTDKKKLKEDLLRESKIEQMNLQVGGIAHDFNNYLASIIGNISLVKCSLEEGSENYQYLSSAERASQMAKNLAMQLLVFSRGGPP
jgi:PAS domain S-box-containing protein